MFNQLGGHRLLTLHSRGLTNQAVLISTLVFSRTILLSNPASFPCWDNHPVRAPQVIYPISNGPSRRCPRAPTLEVPHNFVLRLAPNTLLDGNTNGVRGNVGASLRFDCKEPDNVQGVQECRPQNLPSGEQTMQLWLGTHQVTVEINADEDNQSPGAPTLEKVIPDTSIYSDDFASTTYRASLELRRAESATVAGYEVEVNYQEEETYIYSLPSSYAATATSSIERLIFTSHGVESFNGRLNLSDAGFRVRALDTAGNKSAWSNEVITGLGPSQGCSHTQKGNGSAPWWLLVGLLGWIRPKR